MVLWSVIFEPPVQQAPAPPPPASNDTATLFGWLIGFTLAVVIVFLVARPLMDQTRRRKLTQESNRRETTYLEGLQESAQAERRILEDLEFDRELGIMEDRDYAELKQRSENRLEGLREEIEQLQHKLAGRTPPVYKPGPAASREASQAASRTASRTKVAATSGGETRTTGSTATKSKTGDTGKFYFKAAIKEKLKCSECGTPFKPGDRFCRQCSAPLPLLCLNCGKEVTEDDRFCAGCGSAVNT